MWWKLLKFCVVQEANTAKHPEHTIPRWKRGGGTVIPWDAGPQQNTLIGR